MSEPADWFVTVRVRLRDMCVHSEEDAANVVRWVIDEENGFAGFCDYPDDYEILSIEPVQPDASFTEREQTVKVNKP